MIWVESSEKCKDKELKSFLENGIVEESGCCRTPETHVYVHEFGRRASYWCWCSNCGAFSHVDGVPFIKDYKNADLDANRLSAVPIYLEEQKELIDKHMKQYR